MNEPGYIYVVGWDRFQHPDVVRSTRMPWIRNYVDLLENESYLELTAAQRALLECIWKWTGVCGNGRTSAKVATLRARFRLRNCDLAPLIHAGFIEVRASKAQAPRKQVAGLEREGSKEPLDRDGDARANGDAINGAVAHSKKAKKELAAAIQAARSITAGDEPHLAEHTIRTEWPALADKIIADLEATP